MRLISKNGDDSVCRKTHTLHPYSLLDYSSVDGTTALAA